MKGRSTIATNDSIFFFLQPSLTNFSKGGADKIVEVRTFLMPLYIAYLALLETSIVQFQIRLLQQRRERAHLQCRQ